MFSKAQPVINRFLLTPPSPLPLGERIGVGGHFKERSRSMGRTVSFKRPDGKECKGYYETAKARKGAAGVVVIQEELRKTPKAHDR